jgi:BlaI family penicillinase repressor
MEVLWDRHPRTAAEVVEALDGDRPWSPRTVKTLLARLVKKRALSAEEDGPRYRYSPRVSRDECVHAEGRSFRERFFKGRTSPLVQHFVEQGDLSAEDIERLRALLDERSKEASE